MLLEPAIRKKRGKFECCVQNYKENGRNQPRDRSLFTRGDWATIFGGRVIIFSSLQGEGHIFLMVEHCLEQPTI